MEVVRAGGISLKSHFGNRVEFARSRALALMRSSRRKSVVMSHGSLPGMALGAKEGTVTTTTTKTTKKRSPKGTGDRVVVCVRERPALQGERFKDENDEEKTGEMTFDAGSNEVHVRRGGERESRTFCFDHLLSNASTQEQAYAVVGLPLVRSVIDGFNGTIFAYGMTGSGKTHTMIGSATHPGVIPQVRSGVYIHGGGGREGRRGVGALGRWGVGVG